MNHDSLPMDTSGECAALAPVLARAAVETLTIQEMERVGSHLVNCEFCRREAMELGDLVASLRTWNRGLGDPSPRFSTRLRARLAQEREAQKAAEDLARRQIDPIPPRPRPAPLPNFATVDRRKLNINNANRNDPSQRGAGMRAGNVHMRQPGGGNSARRGRGGSRPGLLLAALGISIALNLGWFATSWFQTVDASDRPATNTQIAFVASPVSPEESLTGRLERLRGAQDSDGFVDGDPVATAWWLIAEARSRDILVKNGSLPQTASIVQAQRALQSAQLPNESAKAIVAMGLRESLDRLGIGERAAVAESVSRLTMPEPKPAHAAFMRNAANTQMDAARRARTTEENHNNSDNVWRRLADGRTDDPAFVSGLFREMAEANPSLARAEALPRLTEIQTNSMRAEALCAVATAAMQMPARR